MAATGLQIPPCQARLLRPATRLEPAISYRLQMPGECEERLSASVAPEHLRGSWQPGAMTFRRVAGLQLGRPKGILA